MSELVNKVAEILNAPVDLVQRSAEARAAASGVSVDDVLSSWAGGESVEASAPKEEAPAYPELALTRLDWSQGNAFRISQKFRYTEMPPIFVC